MNVARNVAREKAEAFIIESLEHLVPGGPTPGIYKKFFATMDDIAFDRYMQQLKDKSIRLVFYCPNFDKGRLDIKRNIEFGKQLGHSFFQRLWMPAKGNIPSYLTPIPYLVIELPLRRASQTLVKKMKMPRDSHTVDNLTGQVAGPSSGSRLSFEELRLLSAMGLDQCSIEFMKYRGGDIKGGRALDATIARFGTAQIETLKRFASGVESTKTFSTFLTAMHLKSTLI